MTHRQLVARGIRCLAGTTLVAVLEVLAAAASAQRPDTSAARWTPVEQALGRRGAEQAGGVRRFGFARGDLHVTVGDVEVLPAFALGSWVSFLLQGSSAILAGDLVVTQDELTPVLDKLITGGVEVTAVHNHLLKETPRVMYMHVHGRGSPERLAAVVHAALALTGTPLGTPPAIMPVRIDLDTGAIARALGAHGSVNGGVYQVGVPRVAPVHEDGTSLPPSMGLATGINFQPLGNGRAAVTGDFVMTASEVAAAMRALRAGGLSVTALHSHMLGEQPRLFFMHFWGEGDAVGLARALRAGLDHMAVKHS